MKKASALLGAALVALSLSSCAKKDVDTLYLYNWTYYTPEKVVESFENEFKCKVKLDSYSTCDEMYSKLRAGAKGYDVVIPSNDFVSIMIKQGMLQKIDKTKIKNADKINPGVLKMLDFDSNMEWCVPYALSATGIMVNKTKVPAGYARDYSVLADPRFAGHATMMDDAREVFGSALLSLGHDMNSLDDGDLKEAFNLVKKNSSASVKLMRFIMFAPNPVAICIAREDLDSDKPRHFN